MYKIRQYYNENGLGKSLVWVASKSARNLLELICNPVTCFVIERQLGKNLRAPKAGIAADFRYGRIGDFESFSGELTPWSSFRRIFEERFRRGQSSIVCFHQGRAIGYIWMTDIPEKDKNLGITIRPASDESYGFDLYVKPEFRKQLVGFELISRWMKDAKERGKRKAIGAVASYNAPMLMTTRLVFGFKKTREIRSLEFFKRRGFVISERNLP